MLWHYIQPQVRVEREMGKGAMARRNMAVNGQAISLTLVCLHIRERVCESSM